MLLQTSVVQGDSRVKSLFEEMIASVIVGGKSLYEHVFNSERLPR